MVAPCGRPKLVQGPFGVFLHNPELAQAANAMTLALREHAKLPKRLFELIVLIVVRHWGAQYAWAVHEGSRWSARRGCSCPT